MTMYGPTIKFWKWRWLDWFFGPVLIVGFILLVVCTLHGGVLLIARSNW